MPKPPYLESLPTTTFEMIFVEGGIFDMGSNFKGVFREDPIHKVKLDGFFIGKFPVTQAIWEAVMGPENNPSFYQGDLRPVEMVSWEDCQGFIKKLNQLTGREYRLSTEAEWEYAARGGQLSEGYTYAGSNKLEEVGWYRENSDEETKDVGLKQPNELGLHDMSGNVWEWCQDWLSEKYYEECAKKGIVKNPQGPKTGVNRVLRGGSWSNASEDCRSSLRLNSRPEFRLFDLGLRLVLSPQSVGS